jgi:hypothetical protein
MLLVFSGIGFSQEGLTDSEPSESSEVRETYTPDFDIVFIDEDDLNNFKKLRLYLKKKQNVVDRLEASIEIYNPEDYAKMESNIQYAKSIAEVNPTGYISNFYLSFTTGTNTVIFNAEDAPVDAEYINNTIIPALEAAKNKISDIPKRNDEIKADIDLVNQDIDNCQNQIDVALAPERKDQEFRAKISFYFTVMIGVLLLGFFLIIAFKSDKNIGRQFLGESGLQFVTMFVLIIAVILFGILGILEAKELTAILSGVSGYILGKGAKSTPSDSPEEMAHTPAAAPAPSGGDDSYAGNANDFYQKPDDSAPVG